MKIRLGALEVRLSRYLGLWSLVVVVFAMQCCVNDAVNARVWSPITYLRWSGVQWLTWAGLAPLVFRLGERHPLPFPLSFRALLRHIGYSIGVTLLAMVIGALVSSLFEPPASASSCGSSSANTSPPACWRTGRCSPCSSCCTSRPRSHGANWRRPDWPPNWRSRACRC